MSEGPYKIFVIYDRSSAGCWDDGLCYREATDSDYSIGSLVRLIEWAIVDSNDSYVAVFYNHGPGQNGLRSLRLMKLLIKALEDNDNIIPNEGRYP